MTRGKGNVNVGMMPPQTDAFVPYHVPVPSRRPSSVLVLGILGIVLSAFVLLSVVAWLAIVVALQGSPLAMSMFGGSREERAWLVVQMITSWGFYSVLLWASIAGIKMRPWARVGLIRWAWTYLVWLVIETCIVALWVIPASVASMQTAGATPPGAAAAQYVMLAVSIVFSITLPILLIVFLRRPHVRDAFAQAKGMTAPASIPLAAYASPIAPPPENSAGGAPE